MGKMNHVCLRQLDKAKTYRRQADGQFVCVLSELEATKQFRFPTGTSDAAQAFGLLLSACRWSCVEKLKTNDAVPLNSDVFNQIIVYAPLIRVIHFQMGYRTCTFDVLPELAIRMTNSFTALEKFSIDAGRTALSVTNALVGNCFKNGTTIVICDTRCISEDALMEFSFGECDVSHVNRPRCMSKCVPQLHENFVECWIQVGNQYYRIARTFRVVDICRIIQEEELPRIRKKLVSWGASLQGWTELFSVTVSETKSTEIPRPRLQLGGGARSWDFHYSAYLYLRGNYLIQLFSDHISTEISPPREISPKLMS